MTPRLSVACGFSDRIEALLDGRVRPDGFDLDVKILLGKNLWSYGIDEKRPTLDALIRYCLADGLCSETLTSEDLFSMGPV
jgi:hypothetical protein